MAAMIRPMTIAMDTAAIALAIPISKPRTLAVSTMARRFIAGPEKRKAVAGPIPAPFFSIPANMGKMVHCRLPVLFPT